MPKQTVYAFYKVCQHKLKLRFTAPYQYEAASYLSSLSRQESTALSIAGPKYKASLLRD